MASLRETIRSSSGLAETSQEEAQARGLITPLGVKTAGTGAGPDEAKMAGTPNQLRSVIRGAVDGPADLSTAVRQKQVSTTATADQEDLLGRMGRLEQLSGLGGEVKAGADKAYGGIGGQKATVNLAGEGVTYTDPSTGSPLTPEQETAMQAYIGNSSDENLITLNQAMGRDATNPITPEEITGMVGGAEGLAVEEAKIMLKTIGEALNTGMIDFTKLGFTAAVEDNQSDMGIGEVAEMLGIEEEALTGLSIEELTSKIDAAIEEEQSQVADLEALVNDPFASPTQRAEARSQLRELGVVGVRAADSSLDQVAEDISGATKVEVLDGSYTVEELLDSDFVTSLANDYFKGTDEEKEALKSNFPELVGYLNSHKEVFEKAVEDLGGDVSGFALTQAKNQSLAEPVDNVKIDDAIMEQILPGWGKLSVKDMTEDASKVPLLSMMKENPANAAAINETLKSLGNINPNYQKQVLGLTRDQLYNLGLNNPNSPDAQNLLSQVESASFFHGLDPASVHPRQVIEKIGLGNQEELAKVVSEGMLGKNAGWKEGSSAYDAIEEYLPDNKDVNTWDDADWAEFTSNISEGYSDIDGQAPGIVDLGRSDVANISKEIQEAKSFSDTQVTDDGVYGIVRDAFTNKDYFDEDDYNNYISGISIEDSATLNAIYNSEKLSEKTSGFNIKDKMIKSMWSPFVTNKIDPELRKHGLRDSYGAIHKFFTPPSNPGDFERKLNEANSHVTKSREILGSLKPGSIEHDFWKAYIEDYVPRIDAWASEHQEAQTAVSAQDLADLRGQGFKERGGDAAKAIKNVVSTISGEKKHLGGDTAKAVNNLKDTLLGRKKFF